MSLFRQSFSFLIAACLFSTAIPSWAEPAPRKIELADVTRLQTALRETQTTLTFTEQEIKKILWSGKFLYLNIKPIKTFLTDLIKQLGVRSIVVSGAAPNQLVTLNLAKPVSYSKLSATPLVAEQKLTVLGLVLDDPQTLRVNVSGLSYDGVSVTAFLASQDPLALQLVLENGDEVDLDLGEIQKIGEETQESWTAFSDANQPDQVVPHEAVLAIFEFLLTFGAATPTDLIHLPLGPENEYYAGFQEALKGIEGSENQVFRLLAANLVEARVQRGTITLTFSRAQEVAEGQGKIRVDRTLLIEPNTKTAMRITGLAVSDSSGAWYPVTNLVFVPPSRREFPDGALRLAVRLTDGPSSPLHKHIELPERFGEAQ